MKQDRMEHSSTASDMICFIPIEIDMDIFQEEGLPSMNWQSKGKVLGMDRSTQCKFEGLFASHQTQNAGQQAPKNTLKEVRSR